VVVDQGMIMIRHDANKSKSPCDENDLRLIEQVGQKTLTSSLVIIENQAIPF